MLGFFSLTLPVILIVSPGYLPTYYRSVCIYSFYWPILPFGRGPDCNDRPGRWIAPKLTLATDVENSFSRINGFLILPIFCYERKIKQRRVFLNCLKIEEGREIGMSCPLYRLVISSPRARRWRWNWSWTPLRSDRGPKLCLISPTHPPSSTSVQPKYSGRNSRPN